MPHPYASNPQQNNRPTPSNQIEQVTLEQRFHNPKDAKASIEAVYRFPLDAEAVLRGFAVELEDGTVVKGRVEGKKQAAETYDDALASGHGGFLLQEVGVESCCRLREPCCCFRAVRCGVVWFVCPRRSCICRPLASDDRSIHPPIPSFPGPPPTPTQSTPIHRNHRITR